MIEFHVTYASKDEAADIAREAVEMCLADFLEVSHPYETPAIIRHGNVSANADCARWIEEETKTA